MAKHEFYELKDQLNHLQYLIENLIENLSAGKKSDGTFSGYDELAKYLNVSKSKAYSMVQQGIIVGHKAGKTVMFVESEILAAITKLPKRKKRAY